MLHTGRGGEGERGTESEGHYTLGGVERGRGGQRVRGATHGEGWRGGEGAEGEGCYTWGGVERGRGGRG